MKKIILLLLILVSLKTVLAATTATPSCGCFALGCVLYNNIGSPGCPAHSTGGYCYLTGTNLLAGCPWGCSATASVNSCTCDSGWERCGSQSGCDTSVTSDPNNCGGCGVDCGDAPCINGVCAPDPTTWARVRTVCRCVGNDDYFGLGVGTSTGAFDTYTPANPYNPHVGPMGDRTDCYNNNVCYRTDGDNINFINYDCSAVVGFCDYDKYGYGYCQSGYRDCNNDGGSTWDGCEVNINTNVNNCGSCGNNCYDYPCTGAVYEGYTSKIDIDTVCYMTCDAGACINYTTMGGNCDSSYGGNDCDPGFYQYVLQNPEVRPALTCQTDTDDEHWCCRPTQCGHDGQCYELNDEIITGGDFYVCAEEELPPGETGTPGVYWASAPKILNLARMIQYNRDNTLTTEEFDETLYLTNTGLSLECDNSDYIGCFYGPVHYSYQYCSKISTVFDGMFNLEIPNKVPVKVSEQSLYDPYGETENVVSLKGCGAGGDLAQCS